MRWLRRFWLRVRYPNYCFVHGHDKRYVFAIHPGPGWSVCDDCDSEREERRTAKRKRALEAYDR
jgi:hypothetical protein